MSILRHHTEWLRLIDVSGPFLTPKVLERVFPQGLPDLESDLVADLKATWQAWSEEPGDGDALREAWIGAVLGQALEWGENALLRGDARPAELVKKLPEHDLELRPDIVAMGSEAAGADLTPRLLISLWPEDQELDKLVTGDGWATTPQDRTAALCRACGVRLGLVTNGECWSLVDAPAGGATAVVSWYARLWFEERITLKAFVALLGKRRFTSVAASDTLEALLTESAESREDLTDQLGLQVRSAVEVLVQALDRADADTGRKLLGEIDARELYEAAITVMMRLVFLLCAEERELLAVGDPIWDEHYAVSGLLANLQSDASQHGVQILERRRNAWVRLLATCRAVYGGLDHDAVRLRPYGGSLFDPDRFPFLEGRAHGTTWTEDAAEPLPIDNRTVLHLLEALQELEVGGGAAGRERRRLSFRELDVEQIGYVYEGLLDHLALRVDEPTLGLAGTKNKEPETSLPAMEKAARRGQDQLLDLLVEETGKSRSALKKALEAPLDVERRRRLVVACRNDEELSERIEPFLALVRDDPWGYPALWPASSWLVTGGPERRDTGTHYTPKPIAAAMVRATLEPQVYVGPRQGLRRENWELRPPAEILGLKVGDPAMGSGAFLVQTCRYLSERLVESWAQGEAAGRRFADDGHELDPNGAASLLPDELEERASLARRLIAERCLYGVDTNAMAVEMAKLSLWLFTLAKDRPFGFLGHALKSGDSLLGVHDLDQLRHFHPDPDRGKRLHKTLLGRTQGIDEALKRASALRNELEQVRVLDIDDVRHQERLASQAWETVLGLDSASDALIGATLTHAGKKAASLDREVEGLADDVDQCLSSESERDAATQSLDRRATRLLTTDLPPGKRPRRPFHWPLQFPEVFDRNNPGFDAFVGNPPYMGGQHITGKLGTAYRHYLVERIANGQKGSADLVAYFFLRAHTLLRDGGTFGLLAVNTIAEGDTRQVALEPLVKSGATIYETWPNESWPGKAAVVTTRVHVAKGDWKGERRIGDESVPVVSAYLTGREDWSPKKLKASAGLAFQGSIVLGKGFVLTEDDARRMLDIDDKYRDVVFPYLNGDDLNSHPEQKPSRWVINFWDWTEECAREYSLAFRHLEKTVKPERAKVRRESRRKYWWRYAELARGLYHAIGRGHHFDKHPRGWDPRTKTLAKVMVCCRHTKHVGLAISTNAEIYSEALAVFAIESLWSAAILQSGIHEVWARHQSSSLGSVLRYAPSDCLETFPFSRPENESVGVSRCGKAYFEQRQRLTIDNDWGLTKCFNAVHDRGAGQAQVQELRQQIVALDEAVARAYGWDDLLLDHDFHEFDYLPESDRIRFGMSPKARIDVLERLSLLNRNRFREEQARGAAEKAQSTSRPRSRSSASSQKSLFSSEKAPDAPSRSEMVWSTELGTRTVVEWLSYNSGWHSKAEILAGSGLPEGRWSACMNEAVECGAIERRGERASTRYRASRSETGDPAGQ